MNGKRISEDVFAPTVSWYPERVYYNVYEVTPLIQQGNNLLGVKLGNGRFFGMRGGETMVFGLPRLLAQLEIEYADGSTDVIVSDESWKVTSKGPIIANNEFDGEEYDARLELTGWNTPNYDDSSWNSVDIMEDPKGKLTAQPNPNHRIQEEIQPIKIMKLPNEKFILDMGQNMVGWVRINNLNGKKINPSLYGLPNCSIPTARFIWTIFVRQKSPISTSRQKMAHSVGNRRLFITDFAM